MPTRCSTLAASLPASRTARQHDRCARSTAASEERRTRAVSARLRRVLTGTTTPPSLMTAQYARYDSMQLGAANATGWPLDTPKRRASAPASRSVASSHSAYEYARPSKTAAGLRGNFSRL